MRCPNCGSIEADDSIACSKCGAELPFDAPTNNNDSVYGSYSPYQSSESSYQQYNGNSMGNYGDNSYNNSNYYSNDPYGMYNPNANYSNDYSNTYSSRKNQTSPIAKIILVLVIVASVSILLFKSGVFGMKTGKYVCEYTEDGTTIEMVMKVSAGKKISYSANANLLGMNYNVNIFDAKYTLLFDNVYIKVSGTNNELFGNAINQAGEKVKGKYDSIKKTITVYDKDTGEKRVFKYKG